MRARLSYTASRAGRLEAAAQAAGSPRCRRHVHVAGEDLGVGLEIAQIAFWGEGNGGQQPFQRRFSAVLALLQPWLSHSVRH